MMFVKKAIQVRKGTELRTWYPDLNVQQQKKGLTRRVFDRKYHSIVISLYVCLGSQTNPTHPGQWSFSYWDIFTEFAEFTEFYKAKIV